MVKIKSVRLMTVGNSVAFIVPKQYVNNGLVDKGKRYDVELVESTDQEASE